MTHFEKATLFSPQSTKYWYELGQVYAFDLKDIENGTKAFEECVKLDPKHSQAHYQLGTIAAAAHNYTTAIDHWIKAIDINPKYLNAYFNLGQVFIFSLRVQDCFLLWYQPTKKAVLIKFTTVFVDCA